MAGKVSIVARTSMIVHQRLAKRAPHAMIKLAISIANVHLVERVSFASSMMVVTIVHAKTTQLATPRTLMGTLSVAVQPDLPVTIVQLTSTSARPARPANTVALASIYPVHSRANVHEVLQVPGANSTSMNATTIPA